MIRMHLSGASVSVKDEKGKRLKADSLWSRKQNQHSFFFFNWKDFRETCYALSRLSVGIEFS